MFTGIIEDSGVVKSLAKTKAGARLFVESKVCSSGTKIGDSININGACLTDTDIKGAVLLFDISSETLDRTTLGRLKAGDCLNIERSLRADSRLGGHFVTGHIDTTGKLISKEDQGDFFKIEIEIPQNIMAYLAEKGSIAVDGISLTINALFKNSFTVMLIPHTLSVTTLSWKKRGDYVNIEADILAKYTERFSRRSAKGDIDLPDNITKGLLEEHGFI